MKIQRKDSKHPRITIAPDEVRVKIPVLFTDGETERVLAFARKVVAEVGPVENTLRGRIKEYKGKLSVQLEVNNRHAGLPGRCVRED